MSKKSLFVLGLVLMAACAEPPMGPSLSNSESELKGPSRETCPAPQPNPPTDRPTEQARQCVPIQ